MDINTVIELVKAGFTKQEIMQMESAPAQNANPEPIPAPSVPDAQEPTPVPEPEPAPVPVPAPAQVESDQPSMADIMQSIAKLTSAVQANAIAQSVIPGGSVKSPTAEDMLAEIIRPTFKERE